MRHGFSLVELSIVLVILGLLAGGVLTGQSLIRAAELRSVTTTFSRYQAAAHTFRDKYFALPGDMSNATSFWGKDNTNCTTDTGTAATPGTCNGNGSGVIDENTGGGLPGERYGFWKHLALAGLIEGSYSGISGSAGFQHHVAGVNAPAGRMSSTAWTVSEETNFVGNANMYALDYGNFFKFGGVTATQGPGAPILSPEEAWNIDTKLDDGKPAKGSVIASHWNGLCASADDGTSAVDDLNASYRLTDTTKQCYLMFIKAF